MAALVHVDAHVALFDATREAIRTGHADTLEEACKALRNLAVECDVTSAAALVRAGVQAALVEAAREATRAGRVDVLEEACAAFRNLAGSRGGHEVKTAAALVQAGAHVALVEAAREAISAHLPAALELATLPSATSRAAATRPRLH